MAAFVTNARFLQTYDWRLVAKNILDGDTASSSAAPPTKGELESNSRSGLILSRFLEQASEMTMAAAAVGNRYSVSDLTTYGGELLVRIVCDLAIGLILKRRGRALSDQDALSRSYQESLEYLEQLRRGERIFFAAPGVPEAGVPATATMIPTQPPLFTGRAIRYFGYPAGGC